jgi:lipoprotein-anchoring transpeptidase ErfK/SrfK
MIDKLDPLQQAIENARQSFRQGDHSKTRYWARLAAQIDPQLEEPWLWLAAVASPHASVAYLRHALIINPQSKRARQGMHWAIKRLREIQIRRHTFSVPTRPRAAITQPIRLVKIKPQSRRRSIFPGMITIIVLVLLVAGWLGSPALGYYLNEYLLQSDPLIVSRVDLDKPTYTPTPTNTPTITPTPTPTDTPTPFPTDTPIPTETLIPTDTPAPVQDEPSDGDSPDPGNGERWIDVDLSDQLTFAYEGDSLVRTFIVSTGTWLHPTVTGQYNIYVKYVSAPMWGPGYYLPDVPYIMYFYDGYGLHGTYWHNNFGTPMSHGCINLSIEDAEWLFYWSDIGTLVNIHE